ncbi:hypothetical protein D3C77_161910 [compost metagenome]
MALAPGDSCTLKALVGLPLRRVPYWYSWLPISTRATSPMVTVEPSGLARRTMSLNSCTVLNWPLITTLAVIS